MDGVGAPLGRSSTRYRPASVFTGTGLYRFVGFIYELWILAGKLNMRTVRVLPDKALLNYTYLYLAFKGFEIDTSKDGNLDDNNDVPMEENQICGSPIEQINPGQYKSTYEKDGSINAKVLTAGDLVSSLKIVGNELQTHLVQSQTSSNTKMGLQIGKNRILEMEKHCNGNEPPPIPPSLGNLESHQRTHAGINCRFERFEGVGETYSMQPGHAMVNERLEATSEKQQGGLFSWTLAVRLLLESSEKKVSSENYLLLAWVLTGEEKKSPPVLRKTFLSPGSLGWRSATKKSEKSLGCFDFVPGRGGAAYMVETCGLEFLEPYLRPNSGLEDGPLCALSHWVIWNSGINEGPLNITQGPIIQLGQLYMVWDPGSSTTPPLGYYKNEVLLAHYTKVPATEKKVGVVGGRFSHSDLVFIENRNTPTARWIFDRGRKVTFQKYPSSPSLNNTIWVIRYFKRLMANSFAAFMFSNWIGNVGEDIWNCLIMSSIRQKRQNEFLLSTYGVLCALTTKIYGLTKENKPFEIIYVFPQVVFLELVSDASQVLRFTHNGLGYENRAFGFYLLATHLRFKDLVGWKRLVNGSIVSVHNTIQLSILGVCLLGF
ncbi:hypothetical protein G4B88_010633 [Cannabis sativa]|uniref:Uncharacterized protein n=1 Tax=Cannabis sativa TaxID=3483 RepID=A0A7J6GAT6_CANSA|nr:hypothetical protein G4B88_010633 [Cannabis sativa]